MNEPKITFIDTPLLRIGYESRGGDTAAKTAVLLHGWPDDARTWDTVADGLVAQGYRTIAPWLRGYGPTTFLNASSPRSGQVVAFAQDVIDLLDALHLDRVTFIGHDWGARTGYALAALFPRRFDRLIVLAAGYETGIKSGDKISPQQAEAYWYQWFWNTERGREALHGNRREFCKLLWQTWSPHLWFTDAEFEATAVAWDNPDWVAITLHSYRVRWGNAPRDPRYESLQRQLDKHPKIDVPTTVLHGDEDGASLVDSSADQENDFTGGYARTVLSGVGHFIQRENPAAVLAAVSQSERS